MASARRILLLILGLALTTGVLVAPPASAAKRPVVTSVSVARGSVTGGIKVKVSGHGFTARSAVRFGRTAGKKVHVVSSTQLTVVAPKHAAGTVNVTVKTSGGTSAALRADRFTYYRKPSVKTKTLVDGIAGVRYLQVLKASAGAAPYTWRAVGLPRGLTLSKAGVLSGVATRKTTARVKVTLTDADGHKAARTLALKVPKALPASCLDQSCSILKPNKYTLQVAATQVGDVARDADGRPTQVLVTGIDPIVGQTLVIAPNSHAPSGLIVVVDTVTPRGDGTILLDVERVGPAAAYASGTVSRHGSTAAVVQRAATEPRAPRRISAKPQRETGKPGQATAPRAQQSPESARAEVDCDGGVTSELHGLNLTPALTPSMALQWKHNVLGLPKVYDGLGGLDLFQFDLDGTITADLGISVSGSATCRLVLPKYTALVPAGNLGAVVLELQPTATFRVTGKVDLRTSVTFRCGAEYRRSGSKESRTSYCNAANKPLGLSADSGVDATLTAAIDASASLDDIVGVTGNLTASVHAGYHPTAHPVAQIDGKVTFRLGACLLCFWKGSPLRVTIVSATLIDRVIYSSDSRPDGIPDPGPPVISTARLADATLGVPYAAQLRTTDNRAGTWAVEGDLPPGLYLSSDYILGKATATGSYAFTVDFRDGAGRQASTARTISVVANGTSEGGALEDHDYCRANILSANDDGSSEVVALPFAVDLGGGSYRSTYVNNNGYVTFDNPSSTYTPYDITTATGPIVAPFFADVDTRNPSSALVTYGSSPDGHTFCVNWVDVGYYSQNVDKTDSFQLLITDQNGVGAGDVDLTFNYGHISWETGRASGGVGGIGGQSARAGYSAGTGEPGSSLELAGSGVSGALLDGGSRSLRTGSHGSPVAGRYVYAIRH